MHQSNFISRSTSKLENLIKRPAWTVGLHCCNERGGQASPHTTFIMVYPGNTKGKYHCTVNLLFDWFGISCMTTDNYCFYLQNRLIQSSQTGGQWYSDTSPLVFPGLSFLSVTASLCFLKEKASPSRVSQALIYF
jgi:hypothetical protein